jgi:hypothetical protein
MLRKTLLVLVLALSCAFALPYFKNARVHALTPANVVNYARNWEIVELEPDINAFYFDLNFTTGVFATMVFELPSCSVCIDAIDVYDSYIRITAEGGTAWTEDLDTGLVTDYSIGVDITIDFEAGSIGNGGIYSDTDVDIPFADGVTMMVLIDIDDPPVSLGYWVQERVPVIATSWSLPVIFYDRLEEYDYKFYTPFMTAPADPTPPANYRFMGWYTRTGEKFDFTTLEVKDVWIVTDDEGSRIALFAYYVSTLLEDGELTPDPDASTVPAFLSGPMAMVGLDNEKGYFLIFMIVAVILVIAMLAFLNDRVDNVVPFIMIALIVWTGASIWLGILPLWGAAILIAIELGFTISGFSKGGAAA